MEKIETEESSLGKKTQKLIKKIFEKGAKCVERTPDLSFITIKPIKTTRGKEYTKKVGSWHRVKGGNGVIIID